MTDANIEAEVNRYISWPGQALGYKIGRAQDPRAADARGAGAWGQVRPPPLPRRGARPGLGARSTCSRRRSTSGSRRRRQKVAGSVTAGDQAFGVAASRAPTGHPQPKRRSRRFRPSARERLGLLTGPRARRRPGAGPCAQARTISLQQPVNAARADGRAALDAGSADIFEALGALGPARCCRGRRRSRREAPWGSGSARSPGWRAQMTISSPLARARAGIVAVDDDPGDPLARDWRRRARDEQSRPRPPAAATARDKAAFIVGLLSACRKKGRKSGGTGFRCSNADDDGYEVEARMAGLRPRFRRASPLASRALSRRRLRVAARRLRASRACSISRVQLTSSAPRARRGPGG